VWVAVGVGDGPLVGFRVGVGEYLLVGVGVLVGFFVGEGPGVLVGFGVLEGVGVQVNIISVGAGVSVGTAAVWSVPAGNLICSWIACC
jgi:hypothetical protein